MMCRGELRDLLGVIPDSLSGFAQRLSPEWMERALRLGGAATVRKRKLPAQFVMWLVIGMALFADRSMEAVVRHLDLVLPDRSQRGRVTSSAIAQARNRLGIRALFELFTQTALHWVDTVTTSGRWRGLALFGIDGSTLRVADSPDNVTFFGRPTNGHGPAGYPKVRLVALMELRSHLVRALSLGPLALGEPTLAQILWPQLPPFSLLLMDKGFLDYGVFYLLQSVADRHWLTRARAGLRWTVLETIAPGDDIVEVRLSHAFRVSCPAAPRTLRLRAITYQRAGFRPQSLLTSLLDPLAFPRPEIVELYHQRWEIEIGFDETKTHTLERQETLRSQNPQRVAQEIWGLAIAYNLVRYEMYQVATREGVPAHRLSYRGALLLIRNFCLSAWLLAPGTLPRHLERLHEEIALLVLPARRARTYPRAVKSRATPYPRKRQSP
jgi:hypothetical protein